MSDPSSSSSPSTKRRRRQTITDLSQVDQAETACQLTSGNEVISCFPTSSSSFPQHQWASFVWNSRRPQITQFNKVDIFLFRADSWQQILHFPQVDNPTDRAGIIRAQVNDTWFLPQGADFPGTNVSFPFFWVIIPSDQTLDGSEIPQPTFTAVQTAVLDSVAFASSTSLAAASASSSARAASLSSLSAHPSTSASTSQPTSNAGNVQHASSDSSFPHWAIAVIVVLAFLAIAATCILTFLILRRLRRRQQKVSSSRNSIGSASPMMPREQREGPDMIQRYDSAGSPLLPPTAPPPLAQTTHDAASAISDTGGPFSGADAAIMADAFRKMLRKPDFAARPVEEGDSPEHENNQDPDLDGDDRPPHEDTGDIVLRGQLAEEGRDIRSVSSSRGVKVESASHTEPDPPETR